MFFVICLVNGMVVVVLKFIEIDSRLVFGVMLIMLVLLGVLWFVVSEVI